MRRYVSVSLFALVTASLLVSACGSAATPAPVVQIQTQAVEITSTPGPAAPTPLPAGSVQLTGAGATFPLPVYTQWTYAFQYVDPSVVINYNGVGSGAGKTAIIQNIVDFAGSDSLLSDQNYADGKDLQMYPMLAGAVVSVYNIKWNAPQAPSTGAGTPAPTAAPIPVFILDRKTLVDIYNAKVTLWNDPEIVALNPGLKDLLPSAKITVVHRSDGSGTTEIFTKALTSFSPDWTAGGAQSVQWPVDKAGNGIGGKGNPGVSAVVINTPNSIGYVELAFAKSNSLSVAQMINQAGKTVTANATSVNAAMTEFANTFTPKLTNTIVDGKSGGAWPLTGYTYIILHTTSMKDCVKAQKMLEFLHWAQTDPGAQKAASDLGYSVLPDAIRQTVLAKLGEVTCNGQKVMNP